jgi:predicted RNA-binding protein with PIN domain
MKAMPYLIDGHNLIPKIAGLSLQAPDDEQQLILLLQEFCRQRRKPLEVYFDRASPGQARGQRYGLVTAYFVRAGQTADQAIRRRLSKLKGAARNWTVVSSDHGVQASAHAAHAQVLSSEEFVSQMRQAQQSRGSNNDRNESGAVGQEEMDEWLALFGSDEPGE